MTQALLIISFIANHVSLLTEGSNQNQSQLRHLLQNWLEEVPSKFFSTTAPILKLSMLLNFRFQLKTYNVEFSENELRIAFCYVSQKESDVLIAKILEEDLFSLEIENLPKLFNAKEQQKYSPIEEWH